MPAFGAPAALAEVDMHTLARGLPEAHALVACQDGSLVCVCAHTGRLIWRLAAACGAPSGASGAAVEVPLGSLMAEMQGPRNPSIHLLPLAGNSGDGRQAGGDVPGPPCADSPQAQGGCSGAGRLPLPRPAEAAGAPAAAHAARLALCSASGALAVLRWPGASVAAGAQLPAESFSAPVVFDGRIVLGCRDDHLYCLTWR